MNLINLTYKGPKIDDREIFSLLPDYLVSLYKQMNGFIIYKGGFHLFGACLTPEWHSIRLLWNGENAAYKHYALITEKDIPFAEDCLGFQFFLRNENVIYLNCETGDVHDLNMDFGQFLEGVSNNPITHLAMEPLQQFMSEGGECKPGELISEYPFFCTDEYYNQLYLSKVPSLEKRSFLTVLYAQMSNLRDGDKFDVRII